MGHADDVGLRQVAAVGVDGHRTGGPTNVAVGNERSALADRAQAVVLELHEHHRAEVVVQQGDVDDFGSDPGHVVEPLGDRAVS
jgi:hypothetical protein